MVMPEWLPDSLASPLGLYLATYLVSLVGALVPVVNTEAYLLSVSAFNSLSSPFPLALAAALGQMTGKAALYLTGRGVLHLPLGRYAAKMQSAKEKLEAHRGRTGLFLFTSAFLGLPPFYVVSVLAGAVRLSFGVFLGTGLLGRFLRFGLCIIAPQAFRSFA